MSDIKVRIVDAQYEWRLYAPDEQVWNQFYGSTCRFFHRLFCSADSSHRPGVGEEMVFSLTSSRPDDQCGWIEFNPVERDTDPEGNPYILFCAASVADNWQFVSFCVEALERVFGPEFDPDAPFWAKVEQLQPEGGLT